MRQKRGQQSSFGMSFGMLFSIFLIIIFIGMAIVVINVFLDFSGSANFGQFYTDLQDEVDSAWRSSTTSKSFTLDLDSDVTHICFANLSAPITANPEQYDTIQNYQYYDVNTFLIPPGAVGELAQKKIEHLDIDAITATQNPRCFVNPGKLTISKGIRSRLVMIN